MIFKDWLMNQLIEWEKTKPRKQSDTAFARYLGVKQSSLSQWLAGNYDPDEENAHKISLRLGDEVYKVLGVDPPIAFDGNLSPEQVEELRKQIMEYLDSIPGLKRVQWKKKE